VLEFVSENLVSPNYWYHSKYDIPGYARNNWYRAYQFRHNTTILAYLHRQLGYAFRGGVKQIIGYLLLLKVLLVFNVYLKNLL